jgi:glycine cleavage system H protein
VANIPSDLQYTTDHEYIKATESPDIVIVGVTDYAQDQLGDVVYLDLPKVGAKFDSHGTFGTIEAVKAVSELYCPLSGEVIAVNARLDNEPSLVNSDPYGEGWMIKLKLSDPSQKAPLMNAGAYAKHVAQ